MKATGIVRRIDDLGRVVVPREIRRTMHIREGQAMEIFTGREGEIILKKYSPMGELAGWAQEYTKAMASVCGHLVCICDREQILSASGPEQKRYQGKTISEELEQILGGCRPVCTGGKGEQTKKALPVTEQDESPQNAKVVVPVLSAGDVAGGVLIIGKEETTPLGDVETALAKTAAAVLGARME